MQNFKIKNNYLLIENKNQIKSLWLENFSDDEENTVDKFLNLVFKNKKGVGAFLNNELIAMILFLNSKIIYENKKINSAYFYAVCTNEKYRNNGIMKNLFEFSKEATKEQGFEMCFLVPENDKLLKMYEKFSFRRTINYEEKCYVKGELGNKNTILQTTDFCYKDYKKIRLEASRKSPVIIWAEDEFEFIFDKNRNDVSFVFTNFGYAIYEKLNDEILVYEFCGNAEEIVKLIFDKEPDCEKIRMRIPSINAKTDFGMTYNLINTGEEMNSIYFGMPYG